MKERSFINTVALARCRDALSTGKLFQQFVTRGKKPLNRRVGHCGSQHRAKVPVLMRTCSVVRENSGLRVAAILAPMALIPRATWACAACYGQSDSPMAAGMNWGILSLLGMIVVVLGGVAAFFIVLARRSAALAKSSDSADLSAQTDAAAPVAFGDANESQAQPLAARGSLKRPSAFARQRSRCTQPRGEAVRLSAPRN